MMTYLALTRTDPIAAAIVGAGIADAFDTVQRRPEIETRVLAELIPGYPRSNEAALTQRFAVRWPEKLHKHTARQRHVAPTDQPHIGDGMIGRDTAGS